MKLILPLKKIHFIGIGGIGMSAIAEMLDDLGVKVQGSDAKENSNTIRIRRKGIPVFIGHSSDHLTGVDAVVISSAIHENNPELREARRLGLPVGHRSEMLAEILHYKQSICVSGTHGKTTTSSLIASVLMQARLKPSFVIGGILNSQASNARLGRGKYVVVEADESDGSFLKLPTTISVITNIDPEHMDFYQTYDHMKKAYELFIRNTAFYGFSVLCVDHPVVRELADTIKERKIITYGLDKKADVHADHIRYEQGRLTFDVFVRKGNKFKKIKDISLSLIGRHNVQNALAAIAVGTQLGIKEEVIKKALERFEGIQRRLTERGNVHNIHIYDDYAHHPVEIKATLSAVREASPDSKIIAVFQPHRYTRLRDLWNDFLHSFSEANHVIVCEVYGAGDDPISDITGENFFKALQKEHPSVSFLSDFEQLPDQIKKLTSSGDRVVCLGAGSISGQAVRLVQSLKKNRV